MPGDFVHLHVHTEYSLLDGLGRAKALVKEAQRLGQTALAITDHGAMHGVIEFFRACRDAKIKPLLGMEAYQTLWNRPMGGRDPQLDKENYHLLLLARDMAGYRNLLQIASHAQTDGYYYRPRVDHTFLASHAQGLIATTGCLGAEVPQLLAQGKEKDAYDRLGWYVEVFGKENFFIELQEHAIPELVQVNKVLVPWAEKFGINLIVTNDVHYVREEDGGPHDVLLCVQTGVPISQTNRMRMSDGSYYLKSREQMEATFRPFIDLPASVYDNTLRVAEMCDVDPEDGAYHLPSLPIPEGHTYESYLRRLTEEGVRRLYGEHADDAVVQERKERELRTIHEMGFDVYYLIVADLCNFARGRNIWWNVRGSGAGSLVAYCTGITGIDPIKNGLIFERFLNPGRITMPDFDLDYPDDQREEMIRYTVEKFGADKVAQIVSFGRMKARAAVRDVGRAQGVELARVDRIAKLIPGIPGKPVTIQDCLTEGNEFYSAELAGLYAQEEWVRTLIDTSRQLEGVARHSGIHAAAVVVADRELSHYTPLMRPSKGSVTESITQFEFPILESIGLLKVDFLGLSTLSVMREASRLIRERHGREFTLETIPYEGAQAAAAFTLLTSGEVSGVFQVESAGMRRVLTDMKPSMFEHIVAAISLYRPGPMEYIPQYIRRMHGREPIEYKHPALEPILAETFGIIVYQEQIIQILSELAGYTPGEADLVRRAVGKKKQSDIEKHKAIFVAGCQRNGISEKVASEIYGDIEFFARYGFNKSHSADYAVITVQTAWLKAHYPVEFMAAQLLVERDKTEKVVNFVSECRRMGIDVLPPDINYSGLDFEIQRRPPDTPSIAHRDPQLGYPFPVAEGSAIRYGMAAIKNVGEGPVQMILAARTEGGPFRSLEDVADRVNLQQVGKRPLEYLIKAGAFDRFGKRSQLLAVLDSLIGQSKGVHDARDSGQLSIFDLVGGGDSEQHVAPIHLPDIDEVPGKEKLQWEKELLGVYSISHPLQNLGRELEKYTTCSCAELDESYDGRGVTLAGLITNVRALTTKKGDAMAYVALEDLQGSTEVVFFPRSYEQHRDKLLIDAVVIIKGTAQTRNGVTNLLADSVQTHYDKIVSIADDPAQNQPVLIAAPVTINGVAASEAGDESEDVFAASYIHAPDDEGNGAVADAIPFLEPAVTQGNGAIDAPSPRVGEAPAPYPDAPPTTPDPARSSAVPSYADEGPPNWFDDSGAPPQAEAPVAEPPHLPAEVPITPHAAADLPDEQRRHKGPPAAPPAEPPASQEDGEHSNGMDSPPPVAPEPFTPHAGSTRSLVITFRRTGNLDRDKYRLREIYDAVRDPRGRDRFLIRIVDGDHTAELSFPNDVCTISDRLVTELTKHMKLSVRVEEKQ